MDTNSIERIIHEIFYAILFIIFTIRIYVDWCGPGKDRTSPLAKTAHLISFLITALKLVEGVDRRGTYGIYNEKLGEILSRCVFCMLVVSGFIMFDCTISVFYKIAASQVPAIWRYFYVAVASVNVCAVNAFSVVYALLSTNTFLVVWHLWVAGITILFILSITIPFLLSRRSILSLETSNHASIRSRLDTFLFLIGIFDSVLLLIVLLHVLWALQLWDVFTTLSDYIFSIIWNITIFFLLLMSLGWSFPLSSRNLCWGAEEPFAAIAINSVNSLTGINSVTGIPQTPTGSSKSHPSSKKKKQSQSRSSAITSKSKNGVRDTVSRGDRDDFFDRPESAEAAGFIDTLTKKETIEIAALYNSMILPSLVSMQRNGIEVPALRVSTSGDETPRNLTLRPSHRSPLSSPDGVVALLMKDTAELSPESRKLSKWRKDGREPASPTLAPMPESPQEPDEFEPSDQASPKSDVRSDGAIVPPLLLDSSSTFSRSSSLSPSFSDDSRTGLEVEPSPSSLPSISEEKSRGHNDDDDYYESHLTVVARPEEKNRTPSKTKGSRSLISNPDLSPSQNPRKSEPFSFSDRDSLPPGLIGPRESSQDPPPLERPFTPKKYSYRPGPGQSRIRPSLTELAARTPKRSPLPVKTPKREDSVHDEPRDSLPIFNPFGIA